MNATLNISLADYQELLTARTRLEQENAAVRAELLVAKMEDSTGKLPSITVFARDCMMIARYAIANLPPELNCGWPYEELRRVANNMHVLPDCSVDDRDMALDMLNFADDCEQHETRRRNRPRPTKMTPEDIEEHRRRLEGDPMAQTAIKLMDRDSF